jgi:penicillin amidase
VRRIIATLAAAFLAGLLWFGARATGPLPPLGALLDPVHGAWALAARANLPVTEAHTIAGLGTNVEVRFDDRAVPHIFAPNVADAYRALGWVHARDRLFQMELQARAVAGTLSELVGPRTKDLDREARAQGLAWGAERTFAAIAPTSSAMQAVNAYSDGVNAYLAQMAPGDLPLEYRLLGKRPQPWKPVYTAYLQARMGLTLAYSDGELRRAQVEALIGKAAAEALFPMNAPLQEPIQPNGARAPRTEWQVIPAPQPADRKKLAAAVALEQAAATFAGLPRAGGEIAVGSNNWAVSPSRTAAGHALLSGDPHLSLSLPSIWYEAHLQVPDTLDVYGVTFIGSPLVPIGFNRHVAWTETNTGADVADYYTETVDDPAHPKTYQLDGEWKPLVTRIETVRGPKGETLAIDTIYHTHRGPMVHAGAQWISRRWVIVEASVASAFEAFHNANRAGSVAELMQGIEGYEGPAQNFLTADQGGHLAIRSTGHYPVRPASAPRGDVLTDGSRSANDWQGWWKIAEYPQGLDPAQGYLASANQQPKDPKVDGRYLGWDWPTPWRAMRINALLRADSAVTPDAMRRYQTDSRSAQTDAFVNAFLASAVGSPANPSFEQGIRELKNWDRTFTKENEHAVLFEAALDELSRRTWDELAIPGAPTEDRPRRTATPNSMILLELMQDPKSPWWDDRSTPAVVEDRDAILRASLAAAYDRVVKRLGKPGPAWRWDRNRFANVYHLLRLPALSRLRIPVQAGPGTLSPSAGDGTHGASWRMVVELGPDVRAWGTYPGGQSGNPVSARYADRLPKWANGTLDTLRFPRKPQELSGRTLTSVLTLSPGGR